MSSLRCWQELLLRGIIIFSKKNDIKFQYETNKNKVFVNYTLQIRRFIKKETLVLMTGVFLFFVFCKNNEC